MRCSLAIGAALAIAASGCSGDTSGTGGGTMAMPTPGSGVSSSARVVAIVGRQGMLSFDPNPAQAAPGETVVWHNVDSAPHRIVMNDGSFDSDVIAPGASSPPMRVGAAGGAYHCTIHPAMMFGSIISSY